MATPHTRFAPASRRKSARTTGVSLAAAAGLLGGILILPTLLVAMLLNETGLIYSSLCFLAFLIPLYVGLRRGRDFDPFEPVNLVAFAILFGSSLRSAWMLVSDNSRVDFLMMGTSYDEVLSNMPLILLSVATFCAGYALFPFRYPVENLKFVREFTMSKQRFWLAVMITIAISMVGIPLMIAEYGIYLDTGLLSESKKRVAEYTNSEGELIYGAGFQRYLAFAASHGFMLISTAWLAGMLRLRPPILVAALITAAITVLVPFLTSSRLQLLQTFINLFVFALYYNRLSVRSLLIFLIASIFIVSAMGALREQNQKGADFRFDVAGRIIGSGNSIDFVRTSAIMDRVPKVTGYLYGQSYLALLTSPIPRAIWHDKPQVSLGIFVKNKIFGQWVRIFGWPAGMIGEGWINFGLFGLFLPMLMFGVLLRFIYESVRPLLGLSYPVTVLYSVSAWHLGFDTIGLNFAYGMNLVLTLLIPTLLLLVIARKKVGIRRVSPSLAGR